MILDSHAEDLGAAIPLAFAESIGVHSILTDDELPEGFANLAGEGITPAIAFPHPSAVDGTAITWQLKPDNPRVGSDGRVRKYEWPKGFPHVFTVYEEQRRRLELDDVTVILVEGCKQTIAAAACAPPEIAVVGIEGIYGHRDRNVGMLADIAGLRFGKRPLIVIPDEDVSSNFDVYRGLRDIMDTFDPLTTDPVKWVKIPRVGAHTGLDDYLAMRPADHRPDVLSNLVRKAGRALPKAPPQAGLFGDPTKVAIRTSAFADQLLATFGDDLGVDEESGQLLHRSAGVWESALDPGPVRQVLRTGLGDHYSRAKIANVADLVVELLQHDGKVVPPTLEPVVAFRNGIVRLDERPRLYSFDEQPAARIRFPIEWDDAAQSPRFDEWLEAFTAGPDDPRLLAEILGQIFDTSRAPEHHALLYGPSRSGKSTLLRIAQAAVPRDRQSSVSLHEMVTDRFATSDLIGSRLNAVAELSATNVADLGEFKKVTGNDTVRAQAKHEKAARIRSTAVHVFSANTIPPVADDSRAYENRVIPVAFPTTFEGREDPRVELAMMAELPGIVRSWCEAHAARVRDGRWTETFGPTAEEFAQQSNIARRWLAEETVPGSWTNKFVLYQAFHEWAIRNGTPIPKGSGKFYSACQSAGVKSKRVHGFDHFGVGLRK